MNKEETNVLQFLTGKNTLSEVTVEELEQLANSYPYFAAAHVLLTQKMEQAGHAKLEEQLYKTALYFPDEPWLRYLLLNWCEKSTKGNHLPIKEFEADLIIQNEADLPVSDEQEEIPIEQNKIEIPEYTNLVTLPEGEVLHDNLLIDDLNDEPEELPLSDEDAAAEAMPLPIDESQQKIASLLSEQAEAFQKPVGGEEPIFLEGEPYHTVDYFASQGIELENKKEDTHFDKKVHKFTDWLRQMKRINPHPMDLGTDTEQENYVATIAATSNQTKEIVTESMAEILTKQNKNDKAIEIYEKLSLLYPAKNVYFAAKIEQLKH